MTSINDTRTAFLDFFAANDHQVVPSSPITPKDDPTLLFVNAGMAPLKDYFSGARTPPSRQLASAQKCVRAGGKHNDLDNVGYTSRHHTFFEMLGNFSFGDYFKERAIDLAWRLLNKELGLAKERLTVTVYHEDEEAAALWRKISGLADDRIIRISTDDNFWSMGDVGPCGPCSEIFYDHGDHVPGGPPGSPDEDGDRFVEIWNLVFMQFDRQADGEMRPLPNPCIDTGSGLERLAAVLQGVTSNFDTDLFRHLIEASERVTGNTDPAMAASHRVIADHLRTAAFLVAEGVLPSNEGRGYVLRRIMRRALRHMHMLGADTLPFAALVQPLVESMGGYYTELADHQQAIEKSFANESEQFRTTLDRGLRILEREAARLSDGAAFPGEVAFHLYDTHGFPLDLTQDVLRPRNIDVDTDAFDDAMAEQRARARAAWSGSGDAKADEIWTALNERLGDTPFHGYDDTEHAAKITAIVVDGIEREQLSAGERGALVCSSSAFYGESGGQIGDTGSITATGTPPARFAVADTQKPTGGLIAHFGELTEGTLHIGDAVAQHVDRDRRTLSAANHSATHLLHAALRDVLGPHVRQKGSYVGPDRLRFDFSHDAAVTPEELGAIENLVNAVITGNAPTDVRVMAMDDALQTGAIAQFDENYGDQVRVLSIGRNDDAPFSIELCGGTHVNATGDIGLFRIVGESSIGSGVRRIEAVTHRGALEHTRQNDDLLNRIQLLTKSSRERVFEDVQRLLAERKQLQQQIGKLREQNVLTELRAQTAETLGEMRFVGAIVDGFAGRELKDLAKRIMGQSNADILCLLSPGQKNTAAVVGVSKQKAKQLAAKEILQTALDAMGGGSGGGSPTLAQGAGPAGADPEKGLDAIRVLLTD